MVYKYPYMVYIYIYENGMTIPQYRYTIQLLMLSQTLLG